MSPENWSLLVEDEHKTAGLSERAKAAAKARAKERMKEGFLFFLNFDTYIEVMANGKDRNLREVFYRAWNTRASKPGFDNGPVVEKILGESRRIARENGYGNYAEYVLTGRMMKEREVSAFLENLLENTRVSLGENLSQIAIFAKEKDGIPCLAPWDISYYITRIKEEKYAIDYERVVEYFPLSRVIEGSFEIASRLYGVSYRAFAPPESSLDARCFEVSDASGKKIAELHLHLYGRVGEKKSDWRTCKNVRNQQVPVIEVFCRFMASEGDQPTFLTATDLRLWLHEFGHSLHFLLSKSVAHNTAFWIEGIPSDVVEFPSSFMENFALVREGVDLLSGHYQTGEKLPDELFERMLLARSYEQSYVTASDLRYALADLRLYTDDISSMAAAKELFRNVQNKVFPMIAFPEDVDTLCAFSHAFGYIHSPFYYSYSLSRVLADGAFAVFVKENGVVEWSLGKKFLAELLSCDLSRSFIQGYEAFCGCKPVEVLRRERRPFGKDTAFV